MINLKNYKNKIIGVIFILGTFLLLTTYRTLYPIKTKNLELNYIYDKTDLVLENNNISLNIDVYGGRINKFLFKKYNHSFFFNDNHMNNNFETGWLCDDTRSVPHRFKTKWDILEYTKNKLVLKTKIESIIFKKTFLLEGDKLIINDTFDNLNQPDIVLYNYGGFSLVPYTEEEKNYNLISYNHKNKLMRVQNKQLNSVQKNIVSQNLNSWFGIEDNSFILFCNSENGDVYTEMDKHKNKLFFLSNEIYLQEKKYVLYMLPKDKKTLDKYNITNIMNYDFFFLFNFFMKPLTKITHMFFTTLENKKGFVFALLILILIILFINLILIFFMEKENIKLKIHKDEKKFIENNYQNNDKQNHLNFFYKKHNIKILRLISFPIIIYITWVLLNKIINLHFYLHKISFLWLENVFERDKYSLVNLYGLMGFIPTKIILLINKYIATDILSITATGLYYFNRNLESNYTKVENTISLFPNDWLFNLIQNIILPLVITRGLTSCFLLVIIFILIINNLFRISMEKYFEKKYSYSL